MLRKTLSSGYQSEEWAGSKHYQDEAWESVDPTPVVWAELSQEQFNALLTQSELATINAASSAADAKQIKALVTELIEKVNVIKDKLEKGKRPSEKEEAKRPCNIHIIH